MKRHCRLLAALIAAILAMCCALSALALEDEAAAPQQAVTIIPAAEAPISEKNAGHAREEAAALKAEPAEAEKSTERPGAESAKDSEEEAETGGEATVAPTANAPEMCEHPDSSVEDRVVKKIIGIKSVGAAGHVRIYEVYAGEYCNRCGRALTEGVYVGTEEGEVIPHTFYGSGEEVYTCTCGEQADVLRCAHEHLRFAQYLYSGVIDVPTYVDADCHAVTATVSGELYACDDCGGTVTKAYDESRVETIKVRHDFNGPKCDCGAVSDRPAEDAPQYGAHKDSEEDR